MKKILIVALGVSTLFSCKKEEPTVCIMADKTDILVGEVVQFTNSSENYLTSEWNFGDGSNTNVTDPSHVFSEPGIHTVNLRVANKKGDFSTGTSDITVKQLTIKNIVITDSDYNDPDMNWSITFDGEDLGFSGNVTENISGSTATYTFNAPPAIRKGEYALGAERSTGGFPPFFPGTVEYNNTFKINPLEELKGDSVLTSEDVSEGIFITYNFGRSL